jgi:hypothetical protein
MVNHHIKQVQGLQHIAGYFGLRLFYPVYDVRLQAEFFGKQLHNNAAFAIVGYFEYDFACFMQHGK